MKWNKFTKKVNQELSDYHSEQDPLEIWAGIEDRVDLLNAKKKKNRKPIWMALGICASLATFSFFFLDGNKFEKESKHAVQITELNQPSQTVLESHLIKDKISTKEESALIKTKIKNSKTESNQQSTYQINKILPFSLRAQNTIFEKTKPKATNTHFKANPLTKHSPDLGLQKERLNQISLLNSLPLKPMVINLIDKDIPLKINLDKIATQRIALKPTSKFSIGLYSSIYLTDKKMKTTSKDAQTLLEARLDKEKSLETLNYGLSFGLQIKKGFGIESGIEYLQINETFNTLETEVNTAIIEGTETIINNVANESVSITGDVVETTTINRDFQIYNRYKLINIPIFFSYTLENNNWALKTSAGVYANLNLKATGRIPNGYGQSVALEELTIYKNTVGFSYGLNVALQRKISAKWTLNLSPSLRIYPKSFTIDSNPIHQKYNLLGTSLGVNYTL